MKMIDAYIIVYGFICDYAQITKNLDVDSIASEMTPMVYKDDSGDIQNSSFDPAVYEEDWIGAWQSIAGKGEHATNEQVFLAAQKIISYYERELNYDLDDLEEFLAQRLGLSPFATRNDWAINYIPQEPRLDVAAGGLHSVSA